MIYNDFFRFLENKDRLIDKLDLTDDQKAELKVFFQKHPNYESKIDWNNKSLQYKDFEELLALEGNTKSARKKYGISGKAQIEDLVEGEDYLVLAENDNEFAHTVIYYPLTFKASEVLAKPTTPPKGITGHWCIAGKNYSPGTQDQHWNLYTGNGTDFFFVFITDKVNENWSEKYAISRTMDGNFNIFNSDDRDLEEQWTEENWDPDEDTGTFTLPEDLGWAKTWIDLNNPRRFFLEKNFYIDPVGAVYSKKKKSLRLFPRDYNGTYEVPEGTEDIWADAFRGCRLSAVTIPSSVFNLGQAAFFGSGNLKSVTINNGLKLLKSEVFNHCIHLENVKLPDSITAVEDRSFEYCISLKQIRLPRNLTEIGKGMFYTCINLQKVIWPKKVTKILSEAFARCSALVQLSIPGPISVIQDHAFDWCQGLQELEITPDKNGCQIGHAFFKAPLKKIIFNGTEQQARAAMPDFFSSDARQKALTEENQSQFLPWGCELHCTADNKVFIYQKPE